PKPGAPCKGPICLSGWIIHSVSPFCFRRFAPESFCLFLYKSGKISFPACHPLMAVSRTQISRLTVLMIVLSVLELLSRLYYLLAAGASALQDCLVSVQSGLALQDCVVKCT